MGSCESVSEKEVILLGLIAEEPIHAYGLEEKIRQRQMELWTTIGFSSIYRVLTQLEDKGLIETQLEHQGQGATRKVHRINQAGRQALAQGVLDHILPAQPVKNPFSVALAYLTHAPRDRLIQVLNERLQQLKAAAMQMNQLKERILGAVRVDERLAALDNPPLHIRRVELVVSLLLDNASLHMQTERAFIRQTLDILKKEKKEIFSTIELPGGGSEGAQS
jgi:DNA-binding PadR family transcriptional regulator